MFKTDPDVIATCERMYFERHNMAIRFPMEPTSAISALAMCVITVLGPPTIPPEYRAHIPTEFWLAQAGTFLNGFGSFIFHGVHPADYNTYGVNPRMLDGMALATMSVFTALLFVKAERSMYACWLLLTYVFFVAWSNDSLTYPVLYKWTGGMISVAVQFPLMGVIYAFSILVAVQAFPWQEVQPALYILGIAFSAWIIDRFFCDGIDALSFCHMFWHIFGTYGNLLLMALGLKFRGYHLEGKWFPKVVKEPSHYCTII
jgi:hypothetical protein